MSNIAARKKKVVAPSLEGREEGSRGESIKISRDVRTIKDLLVGLNHQVVDELQTSMPSKIPYHTFWFWATFDGVWTASSTYIYDAELRGLFSEAHDAWRSAFGYGEDYQIPSGRIDPILAISRREQRRTFVSNEIEGHVARLHDVTRKIMVHVRRNYVEVDIDRVVRDSWQAYRDDESRPLGGA